MKETALIFITLISSCQNRDAARNARNHNEMTDLASRIRTYSIRNNPSVLDKSSGSELFAKLHSEGLVRKERWEDKSRIFDVWGRDFVININTPSGTGSIFSHGPELHSSRDDILLDFDLNP